MKKLKELTKEQKKKYFIGLGIFSVVLLLALTGLTYAWFSASVTGNEDAKGTVVETGNLSYVYKNGIHTKENLQKQKRFTRKSEAF